MDDASYALRFAEDRRNLDGWGSERIERRLAALGVAREHVAAALADGRPRRPRAPPSRCSSAASRSRPATPRERDRALGHLVRKGYELELAHDALRRHAGAALDD